MAKKSEIIGEFIVTIHDNNAVEVSRIYKSTIQILRDIWRKHTGNDAPEKWNTQELGRHVLNELCGGERKATIDEYEIEREDNNRINVLKTYKNTMEGLCEVAKELNFTPDPKEQGWNTQRFGRILVNFAQTGEMPNLKQENLSYQREETASDYPTYEEYVAKYPKGSKSDRFTISEDGKRLYDINDTFEGPLIVPEGVEVVEFGNNLRIEGLTAIIMPDSVKEMTGGLSRCTNLKDIRLSPNLRLSKKEQAFHIYDSPITLLDIPEGVTAVDIAEMPDLSELILPESLKTIELSDCPKLTKCELPSKIVEISIMRCSALEEIRIPESIKTIPMLFACGDNTTHNCLKTVIIPEGVEEIGSGAFGDQENLTKVVIPSSVERICEYAFSNCVNLKEVVIEGSPLILPGAFQNTPCYNELSMKLATIRKTEEGLPYLQLTVEQIFFKNSCFDEAYDFLRFDAYFGECIFMEGLSADPAKYPFDKIGYLTYGSNTNGCLCKFSDDEEAECDKMLAHGFLLVAHHKDDSEEYGNDIMESTAKALAIILNPQSGLTRENNPYEGPEAIVELKVHDFNSKRIIHTYRWHILEKDGKWIAKELPFDEEVS